MKRRYLNVIGIGLMGSMLFVPAVVSAQTVTVTGEACPLRVNYMVTENAENEYSYEEEAEEETETAENVVEEKGLTSFELYGLASDDQYLISFEDADTETQVYGYVSKDELEEKLSQIDYSVLPDGSGYTPVVIGTNGDQALHVQECLIELGYLQGTADGSYGNGTASAVMEFQYKKNLMENGDADVTTLLVLENEMNKLEEVEVSYPSVQNPEDKFAALLKEMDISELEKYSDPSWKFKYDPFERRGALNPSIEVGTLDIASPAVDRISLTASLQVIIADQGDGNLKTIPALVVESSGVCRPYVTGAIIIAGDAVYKNEGASIYGNIDGAIVKEYAYVPLTEEVLDALKSADQISVRVNGKNRDYDLENAGDASRISEFANSVN